MSFPPRTPRSDMKAVEVAKALARVGKGQNFMVACVDTGALTYVALSGEPSQALLTELQDQLALDKILLSEMPSKKSLEKDKSAAKKAGDNDVFQAAAKTQRQQDSLKKHGRRLSSAYVVVEDFFSFNGRMMDPSKEQVLGRAGAYKDALAAGAAPSSNPLEFTANRNCAEPKALEGVGRAGLRPLGMTTVWYGSGVNPYPDPRPLTTASPALPCEFCQANARRIIIHAFR